MEASDRRTGSFNKAHLERICYHCHHTNRRGFLCLLLLQEGSKCARRTFVQRRFPKTERPQPVVTAESDANLLLSPEQMVRPERTPVPRMQELRRTYGDPLSRWRGLFQGLKAATVLYGSTRPDDAPEPP